MSRTTKGRRAGVRAPHQDAVPPEPFLARWSRRKHEAHASVAPVASTDAPPVAKPAKPERVLSDADMPSLESLREDSDYSVFLSPGVSEKLRRAALKKLFHSPRFNELCPLEGEYFNAEGFAPLGSVVTHEMRAALEKEARALKDAASKGGRARANDQHEPVHATATDVATTPEETSPAPRPEPMPTPAADMPARRFRGHVRRRSARSHT